MPTLIPNAAGPSSSSSTAKGASSFAKLTEANVNRRLAIVVDNEVFSAPNLNEPIYGGSASITGRFKEDEARGLASVLENPLANPLAIVSESSVSSAYGEVAIQAGHPGRLVALGVIVLFMPFIIAWPVSSLFRLDREPLPSLRRHGPVPIHPHHARYRGYRPDHRHGR
jgi:preprotein translocase subunit SecD